MSTLIPGPLDGVQAKLERANKHIADLNAAIGVYRQPEPFRTETKRDPNTGKTVHYLAELRPIPTDIPLIAADAASNLRIALDHLAFQLWIAGGRVGNDENRVYFPIFEDATK